MRYGAEPDERAARIAREAGAEEEVSARFVTPATRDAASIELINQSNEEANHVRFFTATALANSLGRAPAARSDLTSRSTVTVESPASSFATRD